MGNFQDNKLNKRQNRTERIRTEKKMSTTDKSKTGASRTIAPKTGASVKGASKSGASLAPVVASSTRSRTGSGSGSCSRSRTRSRSRSSSKNSKTGSRSYFKTGSKIFSKTGSKFTSYSFKSKTGSKSYSKTGSGYSKTWPGYTASGYTQTGYNQTGQNDLEMGFPMGQPMMMPVPHQQEQKSGCCCATIVICSILAGIAVVLLGLYMAGYIFQGDSHSAPSDSVTSSSTRAKLSSLRVTSPKATLFKHQKVADGLSEYTKMTTCSVYCKRCIAMLEKASSSEFKKIKGVLTKKLNFRNVVEKNKNYRFGKTNYMAKGCLMCNWTGSGDTLKDAKRRDSVKRNVSSNLATHWK